MSSRVLWIEDPKFLGKLKVKVFIHDTAQDMHKECKAWRPDREDAAAGTLMMNGEITMHFTRDNIEISLAAHEATHAVLWYYNMSKTKRHAESKRHMIKTWDHPEKIAHLVGNLTSLVWHALIAETKDNDGQSS